jgi:hypothetical protein
MLTKLEAVTWLLAGMRVSPVQAEIVLSAMANEPRHDGRGADIYQEASCVRALLRALLAEHHRRHH